MDPAFRRNSARTACNDEVIAWLERVRSKTRLLETRRIGPFGGELLRRPGLVCDGQIDPRVRILELEGDDIAFERNLLLLEIVSRK